LTLRSVLRGNGSGAITSSGVAWRRCSLRAAFPAPASSAHRLRSAACLRSFCCPSGGSKGFGRCLVRVLFCCKHFSVVCFYSTVASYVFVNVCSCVRFSRAHAAAFLYDLFFFLFLRVLLLSLPFFFFFFFFFFFGVLHIFMNIRLYPFSGGLRAHAVYLCLLISGDFFRRCGVLSGRRPAFRVLCSSLVFGSWFSSAVAFRTSMRISGGSAFQFCFQV